MNKFFCQLFLTVTILAVPALLTGAQDVITFQGSGFIRLPEQTAFVKLQEGQKIPVGAIVAVKPETTLPLASGSSLLVGSHSVLLYPGASVRVLKNGLYPLSGRLELNSEAQGNSMALVTRKFIVFYENGHLLLEVTPDNGTYLALKTKGQVVVKDENRQIVELEAGQEIFFPLFGLSKVSERLSGFWNQAPTGFSSARVLITDVVDVDPGLAEKSASDSIDLASPTEDVSIDDSQASTTKKLD